MLFPGVLTGMKQAHFPPGARVDSTDPVTPVKVTARIGVTKVV
jgi:hypothetical protein